MIHLSASIDIDRPCDDVFDFVADFEHIPTWNYFVTRVDKLTPGPIGVGTRFHQVRRSDEQDYEHLETAHDHLLETLGSRRIRSAVTQNLGKLKQLLEIGVTELQDGRVATRESAHAFRSTSGAVLCQATAVNSRGQVVGDSATVDGLSHAVLWQ